MTIRRIRRAKESYKKTKNDFKEVYKTRITKNKKTIKDS